MSERRQHCCTQLIFHFLMLTLTGLQRGMLTCGGGSVKQSSIISGGHTLDDYYSNDGMWFWSVLLYVTNASYDHCQIDISVIADHFWHLHPRLHPCCDHFPFILWWLPVAKEWHRWCLFQRYSCALSVRFRSSQSQLLYNWGTCDIGFTFNSLPCLSFSSVTLISISLSLSFNE